jgi:hypothetical protein
LLNVMISVWKIQKMSNENIEFQGK